MIELLLIAVLCGEVPWGEPETPTIRFVEERCALIEHCTVARPVVDRWTPRGTPWKVHYEPRYVVLIFWADEECTTKLGSHVVWDGAHDTTYRRGGEDGPEFVACFHTGLYMREISAPAQKYSVLDYDPSEAPGVQWLGFQNP